MVGLHKRGRDISNKIRPAPGGGATARGGIDDLMQNEVVKLRPTNLSNPTRNR